MKNALSPLKTALGLCLAALLGCILIFPEVMLHRTISFFVWDDYLVDYESTFALTGFFYQGGIQLWDFFGQMPHAFFWVTHGMFRLPNLLTAITYIVLSPFADNSARFFDQVFAIVYIGTLLSIRTIGIFLLLKRLTDDPWILRIGTVVCALLFCPTAFMFGTFYQSFYPLLMYFILSFFLTWRLRYFGMAFLFIVLSFSQGMVHTCYMYLGINFFMVSCLAYSLIFDYARIRHWRAAWARNSRHLGVSALWLLAAAVVILGPYVYMQLFCLKDVALGLEHSRLAGMWSVSHYFHNLMLDQSPPVDFFRRMLDFTYMTGRSFFLGYMMFFLSGLALTVSQDRRKWIFVLAIFLVWSINFPRDSFSVGLVGHWVNVLTNPLKVMVRSYQTAINSIIGYLLMPLAVIGLGVLKDLSRGMVFKSWRLLVFLIFLGVYAVNGCSDQPTIVKIYFGMAMVVSLTALLLMIRPSHNVFRRRLGLSLFIALMLIDALISAWSMRHYLAANYSRRPHVLEVLPPQAGLVGLDFHNPKIFPFVAESDIYPDTGNTYLLAVKEISSNFHRVINRQTAFMPIDSQSPRHIAFQGWVNDPLMKDYLSQNDHVFFFTKYAVHQGPGVFEKIVRRGLGSSVLMVEGQGSSITTDIPGRLAPLAIGVDQWFSVSEDIKDAAPGWVYQNNMMIWDFPLKGTIPDYFATNILTHDHWVRFFLQSADQKYMELAPVQGELLRPMTFDVQNIKEGKVFVALPVNMPLTGLKGVLVLKMRDASGITSVWRHHSDETGITFQAPADGWLGIQFPYDPKWRIEVDGKPVHFYRADKSFIGLPVMQGEHRILVRYWPYSWLRWGLPLSILLTSFLFILLILYALHDASSIKNEDLNTYE